MVHSATFSGVDTYVDGQNRNVNVRCEATSFTMACVE